MKKIILALAMISLIFPESFAQGQTQTKPKQDTTVKVKRADGSKTKVKNNNRKRKHKKNIRTTDSTSELGIINQPG